MKDLFAFFLTLLSICIVKGQSSETYCTQEWMRNNLTVDTYRNGDKIPNVTDPKEWNTLTTGAWCWYNNDSAANFKKGKLYNWYAIKDARGLAPQGWHVPADSEWTTLLTCNWQVASFGNGGYNAGYCDINGDFHRAGIRSYYWSDTQNDTGFPIVYYVILSNGADKLVGNYDKRNGFSVLCLKDK